MISWSRFRSRAMTTWLRMAPRVCSVFLARRNLTFSSLRMEGITSSTIRTVVSSLHVLSGVWPTLVLVVTARTTVTMPPSSSRGVTPPRIS